MSDDTDFRLREDANQDYTLEIDRIKAKYGYINEGALQDKEEVSDYLSMLLGKDSPGKGWGADIGFTYEYRPKWEKYRTMLDGKEVINQRKNKYKYRVGISLMDLGGVHYKNSPDLRGYNVERTNKTLALADFDDADDSEAFADVLNNALDITDVDKINSFRAGLPATLNLNFDYNIAGPLYANATWIQDLRNKNAIGMRQFSLLAVTPRLEFRALEAAFPVAWQSNYSVLTVGAMLKLGPIFIGSDNIGGAFNLGNPYGANAYMGLAFSFANKKNKDKDKDGVSDGIDKCKKVPGTWEYLGCPPPASVIPTPVSAPAQPEIKFEPDSGQTPAPPIPIKSTADSLGIPMPDSLSKTVADSLNKVPLDSLPQLDSSSFQNLSPEKSKTPEVKPGNITPASNSAEKEGATIPLATPANKPKD